MVFVLEGCSNCWILLAISMVITRKNSSAGIKLETNTSHRVSERIKVDQEPTSSEVKQEQIDPEMAEVKLETACSMISATDIKPESIEFDVEKTEVMETDLKTGRFCNISRLRNLFEPVAALLRFSGTPPNELPLKSVSTIVGTMGLKLVNEDDDLHDHSYSRRSSAGVKLETNTSPCISY